MGTAQTYPMEKILAVQEVLRALPVKVKEKTRAEVVEFLQADLRNAVKQGHSLKEIQTLLAEQGVSVSLSRMEAVLGQAGKNPARKKKTVRLKSEVLSATGALSDTGDMGNDRMEEDSHDSRSKKTPQ